MNIIREKDLDKVNGGVGNVALGGIAGGIWNGYQYFASSPNISLGGAALAIGSGVIGGAIAGSGLGFAGMFYGGGMAAVGSLAAPSVGGDDKKPQPKVKLV